jgi:hypothetical protein
MILSRLDKQVLRAILGLFVNHTVIRLKEGIFRYTAEDVKRQITFGGDFTYRFGDVFRLVFVRSGTKRSDKDPNKYDILFHLEVELDTTGLSKDNDLHEMRRNIADETEDRLEDYLRESALAIEVRG